MKKIFLLAVVGVFTLSSFSVPSKSNTVLKMAYWTARCGNGTIGGYFACDCTQAEANEIAGVMCR